MSQLQVDTILNTNGDGAPDFPHGMTVTGIVTATTLNQNVTGIITAQSLSIGDNIQFGNAGVITATSFAGDGSSLSNLPASAGVVSGIASGSINSGGAVMMTQDGKLSAVTGTAGLKAATCPFVVPYADSPTEQSAIVYDSTNDKFIAVYHGTYTGNNEIHARIGTVNSSTGVITWGSQQQLTPGSSENPMGPVAIWDTVNDRLLTLYQDGADSNRGYLIVSSISGGTITSGTPVLCTGGSELNRYCMTQDPVEDKIIVFWENGSNVGTAVVGEITPATNTSSWAGETTYCSNRAFTPVASFYPGPNKIVVSFMHYSSSEKGAILAGTVSGNSITFGTIQYYESLYQSTSSLSYDSINAQMLVAWQSGTSPYNSKMCTATLSGTTFTFGNTAIIRGVSNTSGNDGDPCIVFDTNSKKALIVWEDSTLGSGQLSSSVVTMSGSAPTRLNQSAAHRITTDNETASQYSAAAGTMLSLDVDNHIMCYMFYDSVTAQRGLRYYTERVGASNMTADNYVGFSQAAYTNGQTAKIDVVGAINAGQSGLTTAMKYYVQNDGAVSTTADLPSIDAGLALSGTDLLVR